MRENEMVSAEEAREIQQTAECLGPGAEILARLARTVVALRAIIDGRTTPPTIAEARHHSHVTRGAFVVMVGDDRAHVGARVVTGLGKLPQKPSRWWPLARDGRPCAWPEVSR